MSKDQKKNSYADEDVQQQLDVIEGLEAEKASIMAEAAGRCSGIAKRIQNEIKTAKALGIPVKSFNAMRKVRKLERKIEEATADVPEDEIELYEDLAGQFSIFAPEAGKKAEAPAKAAAKKAKTKAEANQEQEQREGAEVLDGLAAVH